MDRASLDTAGCARLHTTSLRRVPANLPLKHPYTLDSEQNLHPIYTSANPDAKTALLQTKIVESYGIVALSRVGFNLTRIRAVIYVELLYCGLCGAASTIIWRKKMVCGE
jgi:hypothetical protein